jgi:hypothetical protein
MSRRPWAASLSVRVSFFLSFIPAAALRLSWSDFKDPPFRHSIASSVPPVDLYFFIQSGPYSPVAFEQDSRFRQIRFSAGFHFRYCFVGLLPENVTGNATSPPNIEMPPDYLGWTVYAKNMEHKWMVRETAKHYFIFNYVLGNTNARWIFRSFDDIVINWPLVESFIRVLEEKYDPLTDVVLRGDCVVNGPTYFQGGSGVLLSRAAVEKVASMGSLAIWNVTKWHEDDYRFGVVLAALRIDIGRAATPEFVGYPWSDTERELVLGRNFSQLPACPDVAELQIAGCKRFVAPVREIVFYHHSWLSIAEQRAIATELWSAPDWVHFYRPKGVEPILCQLRKSR